jgi:Zn-dependent alcohol dehydrogenase
MNMFIAYTPYTFPAVGLIALFVGLAGFGFNVVKTLKLGKMLQVVQIGAGLIGLAAALGLEMNDTQHMLLKAAVVICLSTTLAIGLAGVGVDVLKTLKLTKHRKLILQVITVSAVYYLLALYGFITG